MAVQIKTATFAAVSNFAPLQLNIVGMPTPYCSKLTRYFSVQGCFWGVEHYINKKFKTAIKESKVGYSGGKVQNPSYHAVSPVSIHCIQGPLTCASRANSYLWNRGPSLQGWWQAPANTFRCS